MNWKFAVPAPDVVGADREPGADFTIDAEDELVGPVVLQIRIDGVRRGRRSRRRRVPVAGQRQVVGDVAARDDDLVRLDELVAVRVDPRIAELTRRDRVDLAGDAAGADLAAVRA